MRVAQKPMRRTQVSRTASVSAPVGGWNARDPLANMPSTDAVILDNFFCTPYDVVLRSGYSNFATGLPGPVNSLTSYSPPSASGLKLFAYSGISVYDVTAGGSAGIPVVTGLASDKWQHVNFGTPGGNFLVAVDGTDLPLLYNGTVWNNAQPAAFNTTVSSASSSGNVATIVMTTPHNLKTGMAMTMSGFTPAAYNGTYVITTNNATTFSYTMASSPGPVTVTGTATPTLNIAITGVDPHLFISSMVFKSRLWFVENNSLRAWYLPTLSIGGAAQSLDLSSLFDRGGYLIAMADWSLDAGYGMDDYAVFVTSEGQVAVYKGTDPANASTWSLVGVYSLGAPIGRRCLMKYAGDVIMICKDGLAPLSKALMSSRINTQEMLTDKIQQVISDYTTSYDANFGWETALFPQANMLLLNVPYGANGAVKSYQLVMNTISGAWSRFIGWNAQCFEQHNNLLYFGGDGVVCKAWDTLADNDTNINFEALQSFNYFGRRTQNKQAEMVRPIFSTSGSPTILLGVNADFDIAPPVGIPSFTPNPNNGGIWDFSIWDGANWVGEGNILRKDWQTCFAIGYALGAHLLGASRNAVLRWSSTDYVLKDGGVI